MDLAAWLRRFLSTHPLKLPTGGDRADYTVEVMARVRSLETPEAASVTARPWPAWPRFALGAAVVAAVVFIVVGRTEQPSSPLAQDIEQELSLLASVDESAALEPLDETELAEELQALDILVLAEAQPADETWIQETLLLLEEFDQDGSETSGGSDTGKEDWLQDLELLDELEMYASP